MLVRALHNWNLILAVTPRAGVNTVDNFIRLLEPTKHPRQHFRCGSKWPAHYLAAKFVRNPYARAVSQYTFFAGQDKEKAQMTFVDFINYLKTINQHKCDPHWGYQFKQNDNRFEIFRIEKFGDFLSRFNNFGNHNYKVSDFGPGHYKQKVKTDEKYHNVSFKDIFDKFNDDSDWRYRSRKNNNPEHYYLGSEPDFYIPNYFSFYTDEVKDMVYQQFKWDIDNLGYQFSEITEVSEGKDLK